MAQSRRTALAPLPRQGGLATPFSVQAHNALDNLEDDAGRIELTVEYVTQALGGMERGSIGEQVDTVRYALDRMGSISNGPPSILAELERQLHNYAANQGALMDDVKAEVREIVLAEIARRPVGPGFLDDVLSLVLAHRRQWR